MLQMVYADVFAAQDSKERLQAMDRQALIEEARSGQQTLSQRVLRLVGSVSQVRIKVEFERPVCATVSGR